MFLSPPSLGGRSERGPSPGPPAPKEGRARSVHELRGATTPSGPPSLRLVIAATGDRPNPDHEGKALAPFQRQTTRRPDEVQAQADSHREQCRAVELAV